MDRCIRSESSGCGAVWSDPIFNASTQLAELYPPVLATCLCTRSTAMTTGSLPLISPSWNNPSPSQPVPSQPPTQCSHSHSTLSALLVAVAAARETAEHRPERIASFAAPTTHTFPCEI